ncbi:hypothetical protein GCK32_001244 [Trichostrongylus colubriformis]|uniref:Uncharacterized protein n=1 Tax=Trichostrongylus colubriformis TaxID=6319 RepID=A0AAN8FR87_TRICO
MRALLIITVCALLLISSLECKKQKDSKNKKSKDKYYKDKKAESGKIEKQKPQKEEKFKSEKPQKKEKQQEPEEIEVDEVIIEEAPEVSQSIKSNSENQEHEHNAESLVETVNHHQRKRIIKPKSLKVLNAYEQCKLECKKKRDSLQAKEYVEQLRAELAAAEEALAAETASSTPALESDRAEPIFV